MGEPDRQFELKEINEEVRHNDGTSWNISYIFIAAVFTVLDGATVFLLQNAGAPTVPQLIVLVLAWAVGMLLITLINMDRWVR